MTTTLIILIIVIIWSTGNFNNGNVTGTIFTTCISLDSLTNLCCIILTNSFAKKYYLKLCGCIDNSFHQYFLNKNKDIQIVSDLSSNDSPVHPTVPNDYGFQT